MLDHPDEKTAPEVVTIEKQFMFAIQIAYGMVRLLMNVR